MKARILYLRDRQPGELARRRVAADRHQPEAEQRAVEEEADDDREPDHPQHLERDRMAAEARGQADEEIELRLGISTPGGG